MIILNKFEKNLLLWLGETDYGQYGECYGRALDRLVEYGLAKVHDEGEHQTGFIAKDYGGQKGIMYRAVSLTHKGRAALKAAREQNEQETK